MCQDCRCGDVGSITINGEISTAGDHLQDHKHSHQPEDQPHPHPLFHRLDSPQEQSPATRQVAVHERILAKNDQIAAQNRGFFCDRNILALNLLSSPGAGKTTLIERMAQDLPLLTVPSPIRMAVIVGDLATDQDAQRLRRAGAPAVQITTGNACHLEADMVAQAMQKLDWQGLNLLVIENVGNLVCPASYDLGEALRVVVLSVTEGEDKPLKYPTLFKTADIVLISKVDVAEAVGCDLALAISNVRRIAPQAQLFEVSARTGIGLNPWYQSILAAISAGRPPGLVVQ